MHATNPARRIPAARHLWLAALLAFLPAAEAAAIPATFTGTLRIEITDSGGTTPFLFDQTVSGSGSAAISYASGDVDAITLGGSAFGFAGPTTFPSSSWAPIDSIRLDADTASGSLSSLTSGGGGVLGIDGVFTVDLFGFFITDLYYTTDGTSGIGRGGSFLLTTTGSSQPLTLVGNTWTTGAVSHGAFSRSGSTSGNQVVLVTPFYYRFSGPPVYYGLATMSLDFVPVPEPATAGFVALGIAVLSVQSRRRAGGDGRDAQGRAE